MRLRTSCKECGVEGIVRHRVRTLEGASHVDIDDRIDHEEGCHLFRKNQPKHLQRKGWVRQERRANKLVGANPTPASGAIGEDGDGRALHKWRVESKQSASLRFNVTNKIWRKLVDGAISAGEQPVLHVQLGSPARYFVVILKRLWEDVDGIILGDPAVSVSTKRLTPYVLDRNPPGVVLLERDFFSKKEKFNELFE